MNTTPKPFSNQAIQSPQRWLMRGSLSKMAMTTDNTIAVVKNRLIGERPPACHAAGSKCTKQR